MHRNRVNLVLGAMAMMAALSAVPNDALAWGGLPQDRFRYPAIIDWLTLPVRKYSPDDGLLRARVPSASVTARRTTTSASARAARD